MEFTAEALARHLLKVIILPQKQMRSIVAKKITWRSVTDALASHYVKISHTNYRGLSLAFLE